MSLRKFLKIVGVTSQQEIEKAIRAAVADGRLKGNETVSAQMVLTIGKVGLTHKIDGEIMLGSRGAGRRQPSRIRPAPFGNRTGQGTFPATPVFRPRIARAA
ncbi:MAG: DUF6494 family protein [Pseudolabrys sp.]